MRLPCSHIHLFFIFIHSLFSPPFPLVIFTLKIGSNSLMGAASSMLEQVLTRLSNGVDGFARAVRSSLLISADMAHAIHPNYSEKHESHHQPQIHGGVVVKYNGNQRYATNSLVSFYLHEIAKRHEIPLQVFLYSFISFYIHLVFVFIEDGVCVSFFLPPPFFLSV